MRLTEEKKTKSKRDYLGLVQTNSTSSVLHKKKEKKLGWADRVVNRGREQTHKRGGGQEIFLNRNPSASPLGVWLLNICRKGGKGHPKSPVKNKRE